MSKNNVSSDDRRLKPKNKPYKRNNKKPWLNLNGRNNNGPYRINKNKDIYHEESEIDDFQDIDFEVSTDIKE
jgi:hypothetical protein